MTDVRPARAADLPLLAGIEADADELFLERFGNPPWDPPTPGQDRAFEPGFLLVAARPPVGFAHVLEIDGDAHLELLAVRRDHGRQGIGTALVAAAKAEARARGHRRLTLSTYRDVPWNAPFYERLGFRELERLEHWHRAAQRTEERMGLLEHGPRLMMVTSLTN
ncbi:GNAT family N-acetyltransferase [Nocardioides lianchengensis]|uniref:GNAT family N-acetyltransferase n=1 Tax=Nocardioides lianchengensis TaxID=1045774 RepID=UPI000B89D396|nr:GNAT family N-acetyltransferase [Nocardioides lianchengensis]NYG09093.1 GNAT superfamily N-acetyltransferase [Nocardioides lianchengensis]